ncbi:MAG: RnfABCDGE type electron transport complex subunit D [Oscillospiraceae bacterium]|jgi:electron transport complex protein RnfD|nr:RnfABCDGE type electron transport complex subunit D [Oscillospiraceae bacterium]
MNKYIVEPSPHIKSPATTSRIMALVLISLAPALAASVYIFGIRALVLTMVCVLSCVFFEWGFEKIAKRPNTVGDFSAAVTGVLIAFNLPVTLPFYIAVIGSFVAVVVVKQMFGGIGQNFANPAIVARIVLMLSFTARMNTFITPLKAPLDLPPSGGALDAMTSATPLALRAESGQLTGISDLFFGFHGGVLGETCAAALILGGLFLVITRIISLSTPVAFIGTVAVMSAFASGFKGNEILFEVLSGGLILGAFFMATDYATTPLTEKGKVIFGIGCGIITFVIRHFASMPEGVSFSILIMNILTPYIDRLCIPKVFGATKPIKPTTKPNKETTGG